MGEFEKYKNLYLWRFQLTSDQRDKILDAVSARGDKETINWFLDTQMVADQREKIFKAKNRGNIEKKPKTSISRDIEKKEKVFEYDCFICHASEDKDSFVRHHYQKNFKKKVTMFGMMNSL